MHFPSCDSLEDQSFSCTNSFVRTYLDSVISHEILLFCVYDLAGKCGYKIHKVEIFMKHLFCLTIPLTLFHYAGALFSLSVHGRQ